MADMFQNVNLQTGGVCGISQYNLPRMDNCTEKTKQNKTKQHTINRLELWYSVEYYLSISVTQRISSFSCPSLAMY